MSVNYDLGLHKSRQSTVLCLGPEPPIEMLDTSNLVASSCPNQPQANIYRSHLFEFGKEKKSQEEVKDWYQSLREQQLPTKFLSIAYMKDQGTNFEHEFLLIHLLPEDSDDYSFVCRVERRGNGSRTRAFFDGDYSHDMVRIFSKDAYAEFELSYPCPVHRVLNIQFQRRLDLLRVLELCYSLQESDTSARYTLFQFNCYFMCWMILINLVRGADKWDDRVGIDMWGKILTQDLPQLVETWVPQDSEDTSFQCTCNPLASVNHLSLPQTPDTLNSIAQHLSFCILITVLGPESDRNRLVRMITNLIPTELEPIRDQLLNAINSHSSANLLPSDEQLYEAIKKKLSNSLSAAATKVLQQDKCAGQRLWSLLSDSGSPHEGPLDAFSPEFEATIAKKLHKMWFAYMWDYLRSTEFRSQVQCEPPNGPLEVKRNPGLKERIPQIRIWRDSYRYSVMEILGPNTNSIRKSMFNPSYLNFNRWEFYKKRIIPVILILTDWADIQTASRALSQDYRILAIYTLLYFAPTKHSASSLKPQAWLRRCFKSSDWSYCLNKCISKAICDSLVLLDKPSLQVEEAHNGTTIRRIWRYTELYDFVKARIKAHAIRVVLGRDSNSNGPIASSRVIRRGIHDAIQNIWDSRPTFSEVNPV